MAEKKDTVKILLEDLSPAKKALLAQTAATPGFQVLIELANEGCLRATQDVAKLDPEGDDYERKVVERGRRSRNISEFSDLFFKSVFGHVDSLRKAQIQEDEDAQEAVARTLGVANSGIHLANPSEQIDAVRKTFGISPSRPKKSQKQ